MYILDASNLLISERTKMGGAFEMGYVSSPNEFIPRSGAVHANVHVLGYSSNIMEVIYNFMLCLLKYFLYV